jgi:hypothetical protein
MKARKLVIVLAVSLLTTLSLVAQASAAQFDPVLNSRVSATMYK